MVVKGERGVGGEWGGHLSPFVLRRLPAPSITLLPDPFARDKPGAMTQLDFFDRPSARTTVLMRSGYLFDYENPDAAGMSIEDIAHALSQEPRWIGACEPMMTVAQHCVITSYLVSEARAWDALMHDVDEAVTKDLPTPFKLLIDRRAGHDLMRRVLRPIRQAFAHEFRFRLDLHAVKQADRAAAAQERRDLLPRAWMDWGSAADAPADTAKPVSPPDARALFLERYHQLGGEARRRNPPTGKAAP